MHGKKVLYYENGKVKEEKEYQNDILHGNCVYFDRKGLLIS